MLIESMLAIAKFVNTTTNNPKCDDNLQFTQQFNILYTPTTTLVLELQHSHAHNQLVEMAYYLDYFTRTHDISVNNQSNSSNSSSVECVGKEQSVCGKRN